MIVYLNIARTFIWNKTVFEQHARILQLKKYFRKITNDTFKNTTSQYVLPSFGGKSYLRRYLL